MEGDWKDHKNLQGDCLSVDSFIKRFGGFTEEYRFYSGEVCLRYDPKKHIYYLLTPEGDLEPQDGVTKTCHVIDKSEMLVPWACKMMAMKLMKSVPIDPETGHVSDMSMNYFSDLVHAAKSAHRDKMEDAGTVGHAAHGWIENFIKAILAGLAYAADFPEDERAVNCIKAALKWMEAHKVRWVCTERKIYSRKHKYAGTMDGLAWVSSCDDPLCCPHKFLDRLSIIDWKTSNFTYPEFAMQVGSYRAAYVEEMGEPVEDCWVIRLGKENGEFDPWHIEQEDSDENFRMFLTCLDLTRSMRKLKQRMKDKQERLKEAAKEEARLQKESDLLNRCKGFDKYKGIRKPTCGNGEGCKACFAKYQEVQAKKDLAKEAKKVGLSVPKEEGIDY